MIAMSDLLENIKGVKRMINVFGVDTKELFQEISLEIPIEALRIIVPPRDGDTMLYLGYKLNIQQVFALNNYLTRKISPDFGAFAYYLVCEGIYKV